MKAEEKTVEFMFFSVVMQFVYSSGKNTHKKRTELWGGGKGVEKDKSIGTGGPVFSGG